MAFLRKNSFKIFVIIAIFIVIGSLFYWYEWRPSEVRQNCYREAKYTESKLDKIDIVQVSENISEIMNTGGCEIKVEDCKYPTGSYVSLAEKEGFKNCLIKVNKDIYDTCYKECIQKNGL